MNLLPEEIEFFRQTLKAVSPHYPGFLQKEICKGIDDLCDMANCTYEVEEKLKVKKEL